MFSPPEEYIVISKDFPLKDFHDYPDFFILRPPYQRGPKAWKTKMKEQFLDSLLRGYYIPKIVLREIQMGNDVKYEVIDGQQRITAIQDFYNETLKTPESLKDLPEELANKKYTELSSEKKIWIDKKVTLKADVIKNINNKGNYDHLNIAADLFYRLQQGAPLNKIESFHSKLGSNVRNFVSLHADDYIFDFDAYQPMNENPGRHPFFSKIIGMPNDRMQHLLLLTRFLMVEFADGPAHVGKEHLEDFFVKKYPRKTQTELIDREFLNLKETKSCLSNLNTFENIYKNNLTIDNKSGVKYLKKDYYVLSLYLLLRHLKKYYVFEENEYKLFDEFSREFFIKLDRDKDDPNFIKFRENRQQSKENLETRDWIIRKEFFNKNKNLKLKDTKRNFDESDKIEIYIRDKGICQYCVDEYKKQGFEGDEAKEKARVPWSEYEADHIIPYILGGKTTPVQGQVLCRTHNRGKSARM